jgi:hypothetical protein
LAGWPQDPEAEEDEAMSDVLEALIRQASACVEPVFLAKGELYPMWHLVMRGGEERIMPSPSHDKRNAPLMMRAYFEQESVVRYVFMNEAWILETLNADEKEIREYLRAHDGSIEAHPLAKEIVMFSAEDIDEGQLTARRPIIRLKVGLPPKLGPLVFEKRSGRMEGRMIGLLPRKERVLQ